MNNPFTEIKIRELPLWVQVFKEQGISDPEEVFQEIALIDDLLILTKSFSLLNRKRKLKDMLEARIGQYLGHNTPNLNIKK